MVPRVEYNVVVVFCENSGELFSETFTRASDKNCFTFHAFSIRKQYLKIIGVDIVKDISLSLNSQRQTEEILKSLTIR